MADFGDGVTSTEAAPEHAYQDTGLYNVSLILNAGWDCADTAYTDVIIYPDLTADFGYITACADSDITFFDSSVSTLGVITDWLWYFGNGGSSTNQNPSYNYAAGGV